MYRIYIVEDDSGIAESIAQLAKNWGLDTRCASDFQAVLSEFAAYDPHLVLMDVSLPFQGGYYWCEQIRRVSSVPFLFLSSASDSMNMVMAMNMGADDFLAKPFDFHVLIAKIQALLRRAYDFAATVPVLCHRDAMLSTGDGTLTYHGQKIELTRNEQRILMTLMENRGKTVSREKLMETLWASDSFVDENTLSVNVNRLRKKLDAAGLRDFIKTKVGVGYSLA